MDLIRLSQHNWTRSLFLTILLACPAVSDAVLFQCTDSSGNQVYTDSSAQLNECTMIAPPSFAADKLSNSTQPSQPTPPPAIVPEPQQVSSEPFSQAPPETSNSPPLPETGIMSPPSVQTTVVCPAGMNPLNGFGALPCPERDQPGATQRKPPTPNPMPNSMQ